MTNDSIPTIGQIQAEVFKWDENRIRTLVSNVPPRVSERRKLQLNLRHQELRLQRPRLLSFATMFASAYLAQRGLISGMENGLFATETAVSAAGSMFFIHIEVLNMPGIVEARIDRIKKSLERLENSHHSHRHFVDETATNYLLDLMAFTSKMQRPGTLYHRAKGEMFIQNTRDALDRLLERASDPNTLELSTQLASEMLESQKILSARLAKIENATPTTPSQQRLQKNAPTYLRATREALGETAQTVNLLTNIKNGMADFARN